MGERPMVSGGAPSGLCKGRFNTAFNRASASCFFARRPMSCASNSERETWAFSTSCCNPLQTAYFVRAIRTRSCNNTRFFCVMAMARIKYARDKNGCLTTLAIARSLSRNCHATASVANWAARSRARCFPGRGNFWLTISWLPLMGVRFNSKLLKGMLLASKRKDGSSNAPACGIFASRADSRARKTDKLGLFFKAS